MSLNKSATRRFSLLAGSSLLAAGLATATFTGVSLAPGQAFAYDECTPVAPTLSDGANGVSDPTLNGPTADRFTCSGATTYQTTGISYSSFGNLTVNSTGVMDVGGPGVNLTGAGADTVTFTATGTLTGTSGATLDITTASGDIVATSTGVTAITAGMTNAVRLQSTGGGDITYTKNGTNAAANINNNVAGADAAISAVTNGGDIALTVISGTSGLNISGQGGGTVQGRLRGILAETSGAGSVTLNVTGRRGIYAGETDGIAAVDIIAGTGGVQINLAGGPVGGRLTTNAAPDPVVDALAIRVASSSTVNINNTNGLVTGAVDFSGVTAGGVIFDNFGEGSNVGTSSNVLLYAQGGRWLAAGASVFSSQNDVVRMAGFRANEFRHGATIDFGAGVDTFNMNGLLAVHEATITNLEAFNNSGAIYFGGLVNSTQAAVTAMDGNPDDIFSMPGALFTGSGAGALHMDVVLGGTGQSGCGTLTGVADCFDLRDGSTAGSTVITLYDRSPGAMLSGYLPEGITLVDVSGSGTSAAEHFTVDPAVTNGYVHPVYGAAIDRPGAFVYLFRYDAENQRHVLVSQPKNRDIFDYAILPGAAQSIWHLTAATVTDRQTDLRDGAEGGSVWLRTSGEVTRRDMTTAFDGFDGALAFDNAYKLHAGTIIGGMDLISGASSGLDYVLGAQIGYVSSSFDMDQSPASGRFAGATGGAYASAWNDMFFVDGTVNLNGLTLDHTSPSLGSKTTTYVNSVGGQVEGGARARITQNTFAEPLVAVSWVRTSFEEISLVPGEIELADSESLRGALGLRLGATLPGQNVSATWFVTGRAWNEFEGGSGAVFHNPGVDMAFDDAFDGGFGQAELGVNVFNAANTLSGFLTSGVKFKDGYSAVDLSLGARMAW